MTPEQRGSGGRSPEERERARLERERRRAAERGESLQPSPPSTSPPSARSGAPPSEPSAPPADTAAHVRAEPVPPQWSGRAEQTFDPVASYVDERTRHVAEHSRPAPPPPEKVSHARMARTALIAVASVVLVATVWFAFTLFQPFAGDGKGEGAVAVVIPKGADVGRIADLLAAGEVVGSARNFSWRAKWSGRSADFKAGRYMLGRGMSYSAVIDQLATGPNAGTTTVTIPEGRSRWETARQVSGLGLRGDYMDATRSSRLINLRRYGAPSGADSLEGFLFPATYELPAGSDVKRLVPQQVRAFQRNVGDVDMAYARKKNLTVFDVVTIASLIDREVSLARERRMVAAVIYNRLKAGIPLGIDATSRFETRNWDQPLTNAVLRRDTPYNTRINKGLPPGPIGSPGLAALQAAADPARSGWLYYVANPCKPGSHTFTKTYAEFEAAVRRYEEARAKAGGKQPSGC